MPPHNLRPYRYGRETMSTIVPMTCADETSALILGITANLGDRNMTVGQFMKKVFAIGS